VVFDRFGIENRTVDQARFDLELLAGAFFAESFD
jgi:hypothetical protein